MEGLEVKSITVANLPDLVSPCVLSGTLAGHLSLESETANEMSRGKLAFFHDRIRQGAAAMAAYRGGRVVGVLEYYPIEVATAPVTGSDLYVIQCLQVPQDEGRDLVEKELVAACVKDWSSRKGVVVLGRGKAWDSLGFEAITRATWAEGDELTLWLMKFWEVEEPRLVTVPRNFSPLRGRVKIDIYESSFCPWDIYVSNLVRDVAEEFGRGVFIETFDCNSREAVLRHGLTAGIAVNGVFQRWLRPHPVPTADDIRGRIEDVL